MFRLFKKIELLLDIGGTHTHTWMLIRAGLPVVSFVSFLSLFFSPPLPKRRRRRFGHVHHVSTDPPNETSLEGMKKLITNFCWKRKSSPGWLLRSPCRMLFGPRLPETSLLKKKKQKEKKIISSFLSSSRRVRHFQQSGIDLAVAKATRRIIDPVLLLLILKTRLLARHVTDPLRFNGGERQKSRSQDRITSRKRKTYCIYFLI